MIGNFWAVGRNYGEHAKELGNTVTETPLVFLKARSCAVTEKQVPLWMGSADIHHEVEIALRFGAERSPEDGLLSFDAVAIALDLTARDLQNELKKKSLPWTLAKSFLASCPISAFHPLSKFSPAQATALPHFTFDLHVNGELRQKGDSGDMIFSPAHLRRYVQENFPVMPGDVLLTGTPAGVAALKIGDTATASLRSETGQEIRMDWEFI
jgi:2-keto-4-pentenoate hydratase/2-oxohepta-3-ene-1,7-dioic acid hydratase in catechol pathway